jgi:hypothetical protein
MMQRMKALAFAVFAPAFLASCLLSPGKFTSTMTINADRTFVFTYKGEVIKIDPSSAMTSSAMKGLGDKPATSDGDQEGDKATEPKPAVHQIAANSRAKPRSKNEPDPDAEGDAKNREIAAALAKEVGYRSVVYQGKGKFLIDYAISGTLTHNFVYPFNSDAEAVFPFIVIELRQGGLVRIKAPGFADNSSSNTGMNGMGGDARKAMDGVFTLDTDAEIVSQNNEDGAKTVGMRRMVTWRATPLTKDAPTAVLKLAK